MSVSKIPAPVDVVGRTISFRPTETSDILSGEVVRVGFQYPYPKDKNGLPQLLKQISVLLPDGRVINMNSEPEDVRKYRMVAENQKEDAGW